MNTVGAIEGIPYVPGRARGVLSRAAREGGVALVTAAELGRLATTPAAIVVVEGGPFSHAMIGLFALGVPAVMVSRAQAARLAEDVEVVVDGVAGRIWPVGTGAEPQPPEPPPPRAGRAVHTADNVAVELRASVRDARGAAAARLRGAHSIGLVRSEFLVPPGAQRPDAGFYEQAFRVLCEAAQLLPVTLRLLDIAADKHPAWLGELGGAIGPLGLQGARLYGLEPVRTVLDAQLDAIVYLSARHHLRLLVPYVVSVEELRRLRARIEARLPHRLLFGAMVETPAAALDIAQFCEAADFVALGTNDLMQCLFAADRDLPELRDYLDPYAPVLYRFLRQVAELAGPHLHRVQVCGALSQLRGVLPLLLGLGYRVFSVDPVFIPYLARDVTATDTTAARALVDTVCGVRTSEEVREHLGFSPAPTD